MRVVTHAVVLALLFATPFGASLGTADLAGIRSPTPTGTPPVGTDATSSAGGTPTASPAGSPTNATTLDDGPASRAPDVVRVAIRDRDGATLTFTYRYDLSAPREDATFANLSERPAARAAFGRAVRALVADALAREPNASSLASPSVSLAGRNGTGVVAVEVPVDGYLTRARCGGRRVVNRFDEGDLRPERYAVVVPARFDHVDYVGGPEPDAVDGRTHVWTGADVGAARMELYHGETAPPPGCWEGDAGPTTDHVLVVGGIGGLLLVAGVGVVLALREVA